MLIGDVAQYFFGISIFVTSIFLILLVLVQRGRGGGLTGALGGPGGQSAFGTKAGDLFTRITIGVAAAWIFLCASAVFFLRPRALPDFDGGSAKAAVTSGMGSTEDTELDANSRLMGDDTLGSPASTDPASGERELPGEAADQQQVAESQANEETNDPPGDTSGSDPVPEKPEEN